MALPEASAKEFVQAHHYSRSYPAAVHRFGLHDRRFNGLLVGVAVFSVPASVRVLTGVFPDLVPYQESLELGRFCLLGPVLSTSSPLSPGTAVGSPVGPSEGFVPPSGNAESWFLARCLRLLRQVGVRGVVSFADPVRRVALDGTVVQPGHVGACYQASNAVLTGRSSRRTLALLPDGRVLSDRALQKVRSQDQGHEYVERLLCSWGATPPQSGADMRVWLREALDQARVRRLRHEGNYRYAFVSSRHDRRLVRVLGGPLPYPKALDVTH